MSITIQGVPEHLTREQFLAPLIAIGFDPKSVTELRYAADGVHALVHYRDGNGAKWIDSSKDKGGLHKHRVFIPVLKDDADERTTRITPIKN